VTMECRNPKDPAIIVNEVVNRWYHTVKKRTADEYADAALDAAVEERAALTREIEDGRIETVITAVPDLYGRLMGKRIVEGTASASFEARPLPQKWAKNMAGDSPSMWL